MLQHPPLLDAAVAKAAALMIDAAWDENLSMALN